MEAGIIILWVLAVVFVTAGIAGLVVPMIPGPPLIFAGLVMAAWAEGFVHVGGAIIFILAVLAVMAVAVDFLAGALGAKRFGASRKAVIGAAAGAFFGLFFGIPGIIFGPFIGGMAGELSVRKNLHSAGLAGIGAWLGLVIGVAAKVAIGFAMIGVFLLARFL
jgi:uncharacterized protein